MAPDHSPRGERAKPHEEVIVIDLVERRRQIRVEHPLALRAFALRNLVDRCDRVMAATTGPKPIGPRLEPRLPLGLQRAHDPRLLRTVEDHGDTERAPLPAALLRDVHPLDRIGLERLGGRAAPVPPKPSWPSGSAPPPRQRPPSSGRRCAPSPAARSRACSRASGASTSAGCGPSSGPPPATP